MAELVFLGTGSSFGVPGIGCNCSVCTAAHAPDSPLRRNRSAVTISDGSTTILIDAGPELRTSLLAHPVQKLDAVLLTHAHEDHIAGVSDLRGFAEQTPEGLAFFVRPDDESEFRRRFDYMIASGKPSGYPKLSLRTAPLGQSFSVGAFTITPFEVDHPPHGAAGYRINNLAYAPDIKSMPQNSKQLLSGIKTLIVGAAGIDPYASHQGLSQAIALATELKVPRVFFTHIGHTIERTDISAILPPTMQLARDGMRIEF